MFNSIAYNNNHYKKNLNTISENKNLSQKITTLNNLPQELTNSRNFFLAFTEDPKAYGFNGIKAKQPLRLDLTSAKGWRKGNGYTFEEVLRALSEYPDLPLSIGIVLKPENNLTAIDLDDVITKDGELVGNPHKDLTLEEIEWIIEETDSYTEVSLSGYGLHIFVKAKYQYNNIQPFEMAGKGKFIILTGKIWNNRKTLKENQDAINKISKIFFKKDSESHEEKNFTQYPNVSKKKFLNYSFEVSKDFNGFSIDFVDDYILVDSYSDLSYSFEFWKVFYEKLSFDLYGRSLSFDLRKDLLSIMREEEHQSFWVVRNSKGEIEAFDFGISDKPFRIYEVYFAFKTGRLKHFRSLQEAPEEEVKEDNRELKRWTLELIKEFNIWTRKSFEYKQKVEKFLSSIKAPKRFLKVFEVIADQLINFARFEDKKPIITSTWLEKLTGVECKITNKAINILATCGLFEKGEPYSLPEGNTNLVKPVLDFDLEEALKIYKMIQEYLKKRGGFSYFSRSTVEAIGLDSTKIFKRGGDYVSKSKDENLQRQNTNGEPERIQQGYFSDNVRSLPIRGNNSTSPESPHYLSRKRSRSFEEESSLSGLIHSESELIDTS